MLILANFLFVVSFGLRRLQQERKIYIDFINFFTILEKDQNNLRAYFL